MSLKRILVRFTFILMTCSSFGLAQRSEPASTSAVGGQIVVSEGGLKRPVEVLLDHSGAKNDRQTFTDSRGNFEFRNVPNGSYNIRVRLEGFENVNYPVDVPGYAEAEQAFTRATLLDNEFRAPELMLLHVYVRQGKLSAALSHIDALVRKS